MITEEHRRHLSESHMGIKRTPEALAKFKKTMKKKWVDSEYRNKVIQARMGHFTSEETRQKISKAHISISPEQEKRILKLYQNGLTGDEIKVKLNIGRATIYGCLKRNEIKRRPTGHKKGKPSWNKEIKFSEEQKAKLNMKGLELGRAWNKGIPALEESIKKLRAGLQKWREEKGHYPNWKGGISYGHKTGYYSSQYKEWRKKVFEHDNYTCQKCGIQNGNGRTNYLTAHHIKSFAKYPELRFEVSNGITLCEECHCKIDRYRARFMKKES